MTFKSSPHLHLKSCSQHFPSSSDHLRPWSLWILWFLWGFCHLFISTLSALMCTLFLYMCFKILNRLVSDRRLQRVESDSEGEKFWRWEKWWGGGKRSLVERKVSWMHEPGQLHKPHTVHLLLGWLVGGYGVLGRRVAEGFWRQPEAWPWCSQLCDPGKWLHYSGPRCLFFLIQLW